MNLLKWLFGSRKPALNKPVVMPSNFKDLKGKISLNPQREPTKFDYKLTYEEGVDGFNKLQIGKEYELLDMVTGEYKKQTYQPPNEQETFDKMMHGIRYDWIRP